MSISYEQILEDPAFNCLQVEQKEAFQVLAQRLEGKNTREALGIIMDFTRSMPKVKFTKQEQNAMIQAVLSGMNEDDRIKFSNIVKVIGMTS